MNGASLSSLRACLSRTSSGMSRRRAACFGTPRSLQSRLAKPVRSVAVLGHTAATAVGQGMAASRRCTVRGAGGEGESGEVVRRR